MPEPDTSRIRAFATPADFWEWLEANHADEPELWLKIFKKASGQPSVDWNEAVIEALCWGWIDGVRNCPEITSRNNLPKSGRLRRSGVVPFW
jgi:uncharacterized protein YdeI (YjbR/CyaY-like superfamily)